MSPLTDLPFWRRWFSPWLTRGASAVRPPATRPSVVVYTSQTCPLCDDALAVIDAARRRRNFPLDVVDITNNPQLQVLYGNEIPVVLIDGTKRFFGRVDPVLFRRLVDR